MIEPAGPIHDFPPIDHLSADDSVTVVALTVAVPLALAVVYGLLSLRGLHRGWTIAHLVVLVLFQVPNIPYFLHAAFAATAVGTVEDKTYSKSTKGKSTYEHHKLLVVAPDGWKFQAYLAEDDWRAVEKGDRIYFSHVPGNQKGYTDLHEAFAARTGRGATQYLMVGIAVVVLSLLLLLLHGILAFEARRERARAAASPS